MTIFDKLVTASNDKDELSSFIEKNIEELYDFLIVQNFTDLSQEKDKIDTYILDRLKILKSLDFSIESNKVFITLLLDVSERLGLLMAFSQLYKFLKRKEIEVGIRIEASALFLINIRSLSDYENIIDELLNRLFLSYTEEEDTEDRVIGTLVNYYAQVVHNFGAQNREGVLSIKNKLLTKIKETNFHFLKNELIDTVFDFDISDNENTYHKIQKELDTFLKRVKKYVPFNKNVFLIEENTRYATLLENANPNFESIKELSVNEHKRINDNTTFYSLQRGVRILTEEKQLYTYLNSYGNMHYHKMMSSFEFLPKPFFDKKIDIIDWGCGQGLATVVYLDYLNQKSYSPDINTVILVEPSELALKRAALHVLKFDASLTLRTINKDLDSLAESDFNNSLTNTKLHLFSNILDIDLFSLPKFIELVSEKFRGENYFVCVSPCINTLKTSRLNGFMNHFSKNNHFEIIKIIDNKKGEWKGTWTRVVRVFKADL